MAVIEEAGPGAGGPGGELVRCAHDGVSRLNRTPRPRTCRVQPNTTENRVRDDRAYTSARKSEPKAVRRYPDAQGTLTTYCHGFFKCAKANGRVFASYDVYELRLELISACVS